MLYHYIGKSKEQKVYSLRPISRLRIWPDSGSYTVVQTTKSSKYQMLHIAFVNIKIQISLIFISIDGNTMAILCGSDQSHPM